MGKTPRGEERRGFKIKNKGDGSGDPWMVQAHSHFIIHHDTAEDTLQFLKKNKGQHFM